MGGRKVEICSSGLENSPEMVALLVDCSQANPWAPWDFISVSDSLRGGRGISRRTAGASRERERGVKSESFIGRGAMALEEAKPTRGRSH